MQTSPMRQNHAQLGTIALVDLEHTVDAQQILPDCFCVK